MIFQPSTIQFKRGNTAECDLMLLPEGSIAIDTEAKEIRIHDGVRKGGGFRLPSVEHVEFRNDEFVTSTDGYTVTDGDHDVNGFVTLNVDPSYLENPDTFKVLINGSETTAYTVVDDSTIRIEYPTNIGDVISYYNYITIEQVIADYMEANGINFAIDDTATGLSTTWSSYQIDDAIASVADAVAEELAGLTIAVNGSASIDDTVTVTDSTWSSSKIDTVITEVIDGINTAIDDITLAVNSGSGGSSISDTTTTTTTTWSSQEITTYVTDTVNTAVANVAVSPTTLIDDSGSDAATLWSADKITTELQALALSAGSGAAIDDSTAGTTTTYSGSYIDSQIADAIAGVSVDTSTLINDSATADDTVTWSVSKIETALNTKADTTEVNALINDATTSTTTTWSSSALSTVLDSKAEASALSNLQTTVSGLQSSSGGAVINDAATTDSTVVWSANKIFNELSSKASTSSLSSYVTGSALTSTLSSYVTSSTLSSILNSYVTTSSLGSYANISDGSTSTSVAWSGSYINSRLSTKADSSTLSSYVTSSSLSSTLSSYVTTSSLGSYATINDSSTTSTTSTWSANKINSSLTSKLNVNSIQLYTRTVAPWQSAVFPSKLLGIGLNVANAGGTVPDADDNIGVVAFPAANQVSGSFPLFALGSLVFGGHSTSVNSDSHRSPGVNTAAASAGAIDVESIYTATSVTVSSDERHKTETPNVQVPGLDFIDSLIPKAYSVVGGTRSHFGLFATNVKESIENVGLVPGDFGLWCLEDPEDSTSNQMLRYEEFIAPLIQSVKELKVINDTQSTEIADLKAEIAAMKAELGMS